MVRMSWFEVEVRHLTALVAAAVSALILLAGLVAEGSRSAPAASDGLPALAARGGESVGQGAKCREVAFEVEVLGAPHAMRGTLCRPAGDRQPRATIVLLHGFTYTRAYWDFPVRPERYSALRALASGGYVTLALDWLGAGDSDLPPADELVPEVNTEALHQVISELRRARGGATRSGKVFLVGHSAGSALAIRATAELDEFDGVVATGFLHAAGSAPDLFGAMIYPTAGDPSFEENPRPEGYLTTRPGTRRMFYYAFNAEERVVEADERTKDALTYAASGLVEERDTAAYANRVDVPVLAQVGAQDLAFCTPPRCPEAEREHAAYPLSPDFELDVRRRVGHNVNLHRDAAAATDRIEHWVDRHSR